MFTVRFSLLTFLWMKIRFAKKLFFFTATRTGGAYLYMQGDDESALREKNTGEDKPSPSK